MTVRDRSAIEYSERPRRPREWPRGMATPAERCSVPDLTHETWLPVAGYEEIYEVSDLGRVRSLDHVPSNGYPRTGKILKPVPRKRGGYLHVNLYADGVPPYSRNVHRLVLEAFIGACPDGMQVRHLDGDPANNALANLCWGTAAENAQDMLRHGNHASARKTHCPRGHEYTPENTYATGGPRPGRGCRKCLKLRQSQPKESS